MRYVVIVSSLKADLDADDYSAGKGSFFGRHSTNQQGRGCLETVGAGKVVVFAAGSSLIIGMVLYG